MECNMNSLALFISIVPRQLILGLQNMLKGKKKGIITILQILELPNMHHYYLVIPSFGGQLGLHIW